jgi:membrane-bound serine protease (ClpP class)
MRIGRIIIPFRLASALAITVLCTVCTSGFAIAAQPSPPAPDSVATEQLPTEGGSSRGAVRIITVQGYLDPILVSFLQKRLSEAAGDPSGTQAIVLQLDSPGALGIEEEELARLTEKIGASPVPVAVWVGPGSAVAKGAGAWLYFAAHFRMASPNAKIGPLVPSGPRFPGADRPSTGAGATGDDQSASENRPARTFPKSLPAPVVDVLEGHEGTKVVNESLEPSGLEAEGLLDAIAPTVQDAFAALDGRKLMIGQKGSEHEVMLETVEELTPGAGPAGRIPSAPAVFVRPGLFDRMLHSSAQPSVAYMLLLAAFVLFGLELFTAGIGIVGLFGALCLTIGTYGLFISGPNWLTVGGAAVAAVLFGRDVQRGARGISTVLAVAATAVGMAAAATTGPPELRVPIWLAVLYCFLYVAAWRLGVVVMFRTRFWAPAIAREKLIGRLATVKEPLRPRGTVSIDGAVFPAISSETELFRGESVVVENVHGTDLVVKKTSS